MASIRQRAGKWQARVRRKGYPDEVASFNTKTDAQTWARSIESTMDQGSYQSGYRDYRLKTVGAGTIIRELSILSGIISHARKEWSLPIANPCALVRKPPTPPGRTRFLTKDEETRLLDELKPVRRRSPWMVPLVMLALESAMRRGELLALQWENINLTSQTAHLALTKNGTARTVPLSRKAVAILEALPNCGQAGAVFAISHMTLHNCFVAACDRAGIDDLTFHDPTSQIFSVSVALIRPSTLFAKILFSFFSCTLFGPCP